MWVRLSTLLFAVSSTRMRHSLTVKLKVLPDAGAYLSFALLSPPLLLSAGL